MSNGKTRVKIYTTEYCPFCTRAKNLLKGKGIAFEEVLLEGGSEELKALKNKTGMQTVPQIFIDDQLIGGFTELAAKDSKGELDGLL